MCLSFKSVIMRYDKFTAVRYNNVTAVKYDKFTAKDVINSVL